MYDEVEHALRRAPLRIEADPTQQAAVAAVLYGDPVRLLLIRRATFEGDPWSGHLAFPGGRREPTDPTLRATAIRETHEELGVDLSHATLLGSLDDVGPVSQRRPLVVRPYVFALPTLPPPRPNREVAEVLDLPLTHLLSNRGRGTMPFEWRGQPVTLPTVDVSGHRLWGMTLRMVDDLLHRLDGGGVGLARNASD